MVGIDKKYVFDNNNNPIAVQLSISEFKKVESILESDQLHQAKDDVTVRLKGNYSEGMIDRLIKRPLFAESLIPMNREDVHERD